MIIIGFCCNLPLYTKVKFSIEKIQNGHYKIDSYSNKDALTECKWGDFEVQKLISYPLKKYQLVFGILAKSNPNFQTCPIHRCDMKISKDTFKTRRTYAPLMCTTLFLYKIVFDIKTIRQDKLIQEHNEIHIHPP